MNFYKPVSKSKKLKQDNENDCVSSAEKWESDDDKGMDDDDLFRVDETDEIQAEYEEEEDLSSEDDMIVPSNNKRKPCPGLSSKEIRKYISHTPAQFGGTRRVEVIAKELFPNLFSTKFSRKKLNHSQKHRLNRQLYSEAVWKIDRDCKFNF